MAFPKKRSKRSFVPSTAPKMRVTGRVAVALVWALRSLNAQCECTEVRFRQQMLRVAACQSRCVCILDTRLQGYS